MRCYQCPNTAVGMCRFCGAGVCAAHTSARRFVSGWQDYGPYGILMAEVAYDYVVVENALWCGRCKVVSYRAREKEPR